MTRIKRRIISGGIVFGCVMTAIGAGAKLSRSAAPTAVPAALSGNFSEPPTIVIDAGHGEST